MVNAKPNDPGSSAEGEFAHVVKRFFGACEYNRHQPSISSPRCGAGYETHFVGIKYRLLENLRIEFYCYRPSQLGIILAAQPNVNFPEGDFLRPGTPITKNMIGVFLRFFVQQIFRNPLIYRK